VVARVVAVVSRTELVFTIVGWALILAGIVAVLNGH
jgi:hypothetical protein